MRLSWIIEGTWHIFSAKVGLYSKNVHTHQNVTSELNTGKGWNTVHKGQWQKDSDVYVSCVSRDQDTLETPKDNEEQPAPNGDESASKEDEKRERERRDRERELERERDREKEKEKEKEGGKPPLDDGAIPPGVEEIEKTQATEYFSIFNSFTPTLNGRYIRSSQVSNGKPVYSAEAEDVNAHIFHYVKLRHGADPIALGIANKSHTRPTRA